MKSGVIQMMAPRVKVTRLERKSTSVDVCGVRVADVGDAAVAGERKTWRSAGRGEYGCLDVVASRRRKRGMGEGAVVCGQCEAGGRWQVGEGKIE